MRQLDHPQQLANRPFVRVGHIPVSGHCVANT